MKYSIIQIATQNKFTLVNLVIFGILLLLFIQTQGILWYFVDFFLFIFLIIVIWRAFRRIKSDRSPVKIVKNKTLDKKTRYIKSFWVPIGHFILGIMIVVIFLLFITATPYLKGWINEGYLQDITNDIIEENHTDTDKITALLKWFDRNSDDMHNIWFLQKKTLFALLPNHFLIFSEEPYLCIRCTEDMDAKWILTSRCGSCGEYSRIFMVIADAMGISVKRVHAQGEDHVWNEVKIDGEWIPVDPTNVSLPDGGDGWENYGFFEHKEGNASYIWAENLDNTAIEDLTSLYTKLTNVTIHCVDQINNSISDATITIISHNLRRDPYHETFIKNKPNPKTNETGYCTFQIGGGNYTFRAENQNHKLVGEITWLEFTDNEPSHEFQITLRGTEG